MYCKPGDTIRFYVFYADKTTGLGKTGLTVSVNVNRDGTNAVAAGSATALDAANQPGWYYYDYVVPAGYYGGLQAYFSTADTSVSARGGASLYLSVAWLVFVDAAISGALTGAAFDTRLAAARAAKIDNLDVLLSSRAASGATVTVVSAVAQDGDVTIRQGRDYSGAYALTWTLSTPPSPDPSAVVMTCRRLGLSKTGTYSVPTVTVELSAAETAALGRGKYAFEIEGTISSLSVALVDGELTVERDV